MQKKENLGTDLVPFIKIKIKPQWIIDWNVNTKFKFFRKNMGENLGRFKFKILKYISKKKGKQNYTGILNSWISWHK